MKTSNMNHTVRILGAVLIALSTIAASAPAGPAAGPLKVKVTAELANVRQKPSISSIIIRQFPQGDILEAVRKEGEWYLLKFEPDESGATSGYVHESLVLALDEIPKQEQPSRLIEPPAKTEPVVVQPPRIERQVEKPVADAAAAQAAAGEAVPIGTAARASLTIYSGGSLIVGGDLNTAAQGLADYYTEITGVAGDAKVSPARLGLLYGGEFAFPLSPQFYVVAGAEFHGASKSSLVSYARGSVTDTFTATPGFQALPLRLGLAFYPVEYFFVKVGAAYYFAKASYDDRYVHDKYWQEWQGDATAQGFGFWGGLGLDWPLGDAFSLLIEATGEYASISGFQGTGTYLDSTSSSTVSETGKLYFWNARTSSQTSYPTAFIRSKSPSEAGVENVREATADFSGLAIRVGFKIRF
jgi:hypothetical protein